MLSILLAASAGHGLHTSGPKNNHVVIEQSAGVVEQSAGALVGIWCWSHTHLGVQQVPITREMATCPF